MAQSSEGPGSPGHGGAPLQGALFMCVSAFGFAIMNAMVRQASQDLHPFEVAFFRNFIACAMLLPVAARGGWSMVKTERLPLHLVRACISLTAMLCWFSSLALLPLAQAVALNFTVPLFATIGAAVVLGEVVRARRWAATIAGFLGVLVIVRPGFVEVSAATALPVMASVAMAAAILTVKALSRTESPGTIVFFMTFLLTPMSLVPALFVWSWPTWETWGWLLGIGLVGNISHLFLTRAYACADASAVLPFDYSRLPFTAAVAYLAFGQVPDVWTWVGAAIIAASAIYIAHRERVAAHAREKVAALGPGERP